MRNIASVTDSTSIERLKIERAGVAAGSKILVGEFAKAAGADKKGNEISNCLRTGANEPIAFRGMMTCRIWVP